MKKHILFILLIIILNSAYSQNYKKQVENNNRFTFELFSNINIVNDNLFLSPFSVSTALAMTYEGARTKTRAEMSEVLHFPEEAKTINSNFKNIISDTQKTTNPKFYILNIANSIWAQNDYKFLHSFFETVQKYYDAKIETVNFKDKDTRELARIKINNWTAKKTKNKIKDLLDKNSLDSDTKMVLVNTVYFLAKWDKQFNEKATKSDFFYGISGKTDKDFMHVKNRMKYAEKEETKLLEIPYKNKRASMIIIMPDTSVSFNNFKTSFNFDSFNKLYKSADYRNVMLSLPKFKIKYKKDLAKVLYDAGMQRAFTNRADFSGMTCKKELRIDKVIHQTFIDVDESGTEAAAATAVVMKRITSVNPNDLIEFKANRSLIFLIKENTTGSILFIGQLVK